LPPSLIPSPHGLNPAGPRLPRRSEMGRNPFNTQPCVSTLALQKPDSPQHICLGGSGMGQVQTRRRPVSLVCFRPVDTDILHENYPFSRQPLASSHIKPYYYTPDASKLQAFFEISTKIIYRSFHEYFG